MSAETAAAAAAAAAATHRDTHHRHHHRHRRDAGAGAAEAAHSPPDAGRALPALPPTPVIVGLRAGPDAGTTPSPIDMVAPVPAPAVRVQTGAPRRPTAHAPSPRALLAGAHWGAAARAAPDAHAAAAHTGCAQSEAEHSSREDDDDDDDGNDDEVADDARSEPGYLDDLADEFLQSLRTMPPHSLMRGTPARPWDARSAEHDSASPSSTASPSSPSSASSAESLSESAGAARTRDTARHCAGRHAETSSTLSAATASSYTATTSGYFRPSSSSASSSPASSSSSRSLSSLSSAMSTSSSSSSSSASSSSSSSCSSSCSSMSGSLLTTASRSSRSSLSSSAASLSSATSVTRSTHSRASLHLALASPRSCQTDTALDASSGTGSESAAGRGHTAPSQTRPRTPRPHTGTGTAEDGVSVQISWRKAGTLGEGTFGKVYLGIDEATGEFLAVREMALASRAVRQSAEFRQMQEGVQRLQSVRHPNLLRCVGMSVRGLAVELFMEYVSGGSIAALLHAIGPLRESVVVLYVRQVLAALAYLHARGVAHRRLRGSNLLLSSGEGGAVVKLADYGYSPQSAQLFRHARAPRAHWTAPETAAAARCTDRSDVWGLACTVIEMATGAPPWADRANDAVLRLLRRGAVPALPPALSPPAADFLARCLAPDPAARPAAAQLLAHPWLRPREHSAPAPAGPAPAPAAIAASAPTGSRTPRGTRRTGVPSAAPVPSARHSPVLQPHRSPVCGDDDEDDEDEDEEGMLVGAGARGMSRSESAIARMTHGLHGKPTSVADAVRLSEALRMYTRPTESYDCRCCRHRTPSFEHSIDVSVASAAVQQHMQERAREQQLAAVQWTAMAFPSHK